MFYAPSQLFVPGDASATVDRIAERQHLFVATIIVGIVSEFLFVSVVLLLYRLLKPVDDMLAGLMLLSIMLQVPLAFLGMANEVATLQFIRGGEFLQVFDEQQRDALIMFLMYVDRQGVLVSQVFWGVWLLPLGALVFRSKMIPRVLGIWLVLNGLAYIALSAIGLARPELRASAFSLATPLMFGELALALWLLIMGVKLRSPGEAAK
jgi:hypothetical protein